MLKLLRLPSSLTVVQVRHGPRPNITKPLLRHRRRRVLEAAVAPELPRPRLTEAERCSNNLAARQARHNALTTPYEVELALCRHIHSLLCDRPVMFLCHEHQYSGRVRRRITGHLAIRGLHLTEHYGNFIMKMYIRLFRPEWSNLTDMFSARTAMILTDTQEPRYDALLQELGRWPQLVLMAGATPERLLSVPDIERLARHGTVSSANTDTAALLTRSSSRLVQTLRSPAMQLSALLNAHVEGMRNSGSENSMAGKIGFIGLGNMGRHMAQNLIKKSGRQLVVFDVSKTAVEEAKTAGAEAATSAKDVAAECELVVTMLPSSKEVRQVYSSFAAPRPSSLFIDGSTIEPHVSQDLAQWAAATQANYLDAPVSGGIVAAESGQLTFMVGGDATAFAQAKPMLLHMGKAAIHCGQSGMGQATKIANNLLLAISMIGVSEAMNLGQKLGLDAKLLAGVLNQSTGRCWSSDTYNPVPGVIDGVPSSREYAGGFGTSLMAKDLGLAQSAAQQTGVHIPLGDSAAKIYQALAKDDSFNKRDFSVVYQYIKSL